MCVYILKKLLQPNTLNKMLLYNKHFINEKTEMVY